MFFSAPAEGPRQVFYKLFLDKRGRQDIIWYSLLDNTVSAVHSCIQHPQERGCILGDGEQ
jgi:hypothetical protein